MTLGAENKNASETNINYAANIKRPQDLAADFERSYYGLLKK
jgi:hypothetical protein